MIKGDWVSAYPSTLLQFQGIVQQPGPIAPIGILKIAVNSQYGKLKKKRFPRKAKKWAKKNSVQLISVSGKRFSYAREYGPPFYLARTIYS